MNKKPRTHDEVQSPSALRLAAPIEDPLAVAVGGKAGDDVGDDHEQRCGTDHRVRCPIVVRKAARDLNCEQFEDTS